MASKAEYRLIRNSPADDAVFPAVYGELGRRTRQTFGQTFEERRIAAVLKTQAAWREYLKNAKESGLIDTDRYRAGHMCRPAGVVRKGLKAKRCCLAMCPFCYYRSLYKHLTTLNWSMFTRLDAVFWQRPVDEELVTERSVVNDVVATVAKRRAELARACYDSGPALSFCRLWVERRPEQPADYYIQVALMGEHLEVASASAVVQEEGQLETVSGVHLDRIAGSFRYCPSYLTLPYDVSVAVADWNSQFRDRVRTGKSSETDSENDPLGDS